MGLLDDIPADYAENLEVGHVMTVKLNGAAVKLEVGLEGVTLRTGAKTMPVSDEAITALTHILVTRDLMIRANTQIKPCTDHNHGH